MLDMFGMISNYEERKIANTKVGKAEIDTCKVTDVYAIAETGIKHPQYNEGKWIIVEEYHSVEEAKNGHKKWVAVFKKGLPEELKDVSSFIFKQLADIMGNDPTHKRSELKKRKEKKS